MELSESFIKWRLYFTVVAIAILLSLIRKEANDLMFPLPLQEEYVKVSFQEDKSLYQEQMKAYQAARKLIEGKQFGLRSIIGLGYLLTGVLFPVASVGTALVIAGIFETVGALWSHWNDIERVIRLISLILTLLLMGFFLYRWTRKQ